MGWLLGSIGKPPDRIREADIRNVHPVPDFRHSAEGLYIAAGGTPHTIRFGKPEGPDDAGAFWLVLGVGLAVGEDSATVLAAAAWEGILTNSEPRTCLPDGHFLALRGTRQGIDFYCDRAGLRMIFSICRNGVCYFSTRQDWLARLVPGLEPDYTAIASRWLCFNQLSTRALLGGVERSGAGAWGRLAPGSASMQCREWQGRLQQAQPEDFDRRLAALCRPDGLGGARLSLGLSGGLDSRAILAGIGTGGKRVDFASHVFGHRDAPDVRVSRAIAAAGGFPHRLFDQPPPDTTTECVALLEDYAPAACFTEMASAVLHVRFYRNLAEAGCFLIDGGFGEIARRQFLNRLLLRGRAALRSRDPRRILPYLRVERGAFFSPEIQAVMESAVLQEVESTLQNCAAITEGPENIADLFSIRGRLPNYDGYEQSRMDCVLGSIMPFAQSALLDILMALAPAQRRNGTLLHAFIARHSPDLEHFALVKNGSARPYTMGFYAGRLYTVLIRKLRGGFTDPYRVQFFATLREFIFDLLESRAVRECPAYNYPALRAAVEAYYRDTGAQQHTPDWWLSFEMWRRSLGGKEA